MNKKNAKLAELLYAASDSNADMLYLSGFSGPDPFIAIKHKNKSIGLFNQLEFGRAKKESSLSQILSLEEIQQKAKKASKKKQINAADVISFIANELKIKHFQVPYNFPTGLAQELSKAKLKITPIPDPFFPKTKHQNPRTSPTN